MTLWMERAMEFIPGSAGLWLFAAILVRALARILLLAMEK